MAAAIRMCAALLAMTPAVARADAAACEAIAQKWAASRAELAAPQVSAVLFAAADNGCASLATAVLDAGASVEARDRLGNMPLAHAARAGEVGVMQILLTRGADVAARNVAGGSALYLAAERHRTEAALFLLDHGADAAAPGRSAVSPLAAAAFNGDATLLAALLAHGADPHAIDSTGKSAIVYAAAQGGGLVVKKLLDAGVDINARYQNDLTVLMWAAGYADDAPAASAVAMVGDLLARGARIDEADDRGRTALMIAAERGHAVVVDLLLANGADRYLRDRAGKNAADLATDLALRQRLQPG